MFHCTPPRKLKVPTAGVTVGVSRRLGMTPEASEEASGQSSRSVSKRQRLFFMGILPFSKNHVGKTLPGRRRESVSADPGNAHTFQISPAYSRIVRSEENFPEAATFIRHFFAKASGRVPASVMAASFASR